VIILSKTIWYIKNVFWHIGYCWDYIYYPVKRKLFPKAKYSDREKAYIIRQALKTEEGRLALAQAMVEPIRRSLDYQAVGRKLLMVDELPPGTIAHYEQGGIEIAKLNEHLNKRFRERNEKRN